VQTKVYDTNHRLSFYAQAHLPDYNVPEETLEKDEDGEFIRPLKKVYDSEQAMAAAMQGLSHDLYTFWPDVVIFVSAFYTSTQTLQVIKARRHKIVIIHTESPYQDDEQLIRGQWADLNLLNDPQNVEEYRSLVPNSHYMPHAYNPKIHYPSIKAHETDFAFVGTMFKSRKVFFERLFAKFQGYKVALGGAGFDNEFMNDSPLLSLLGHPRDSCIDNVNTASIYRNARSGINFYRRESEGSHQGEGWAMGPREVEMAACGLPFARDPRGESDEIFPFLPSFSSPEEAADQLAWLLREEELRQTLGSMARNAIKDRTFLNNAQQMLTYLEKR
jgi:glycosyltransferase involved in cell wall biosynthesis